MILKEGWALLKSYFENNSAVSADTVSNFLDGVDDHIEVQLRPMFGWIMGLEPGEQEVEEAFRMIRARRGKGRGNVQILKNDCSNTHIS